MTVHVKDYDDMKDEDKENGTCPSEAKSILVLHVLG